MFEQLSGPKLAILAAVAVALLVLAVTLMRAAQKRRTERRLGGL